MKNKIIYGSAGTGKTKLFTSIIEEFKGNVLAILGKELVKSFFNNLSQFKVRDLIEINLTDTDESKVIGTIKHDKDFYWYDKHLNDLLTIINNTSLSKPILVGIDEFSMFHLTKKLDDKSIFLKLLENENIHVVICIQSLDFLRMTYKDEYRIILDHSELISTKSFLEYTGELRLRLPKSLHKELSMKAEKEAISLNQYICYLLSRNI